MLNFSESGHPVFRESSTLERGDLKSKGKEKLSIHVGGDDKNVEVVLLTIVFVNQLSMYGAVADMCDELTYRISDLSERTGKLFVQDNPETTYIPAELMTTNNSLRIDTIVQGNMLRDHEQKIANLPYHLQLCRLCSTASITKNVTRRQYFHVLRRCGTGK